MPAYNSSLSPIKNIQALARAIGLSNIGTTVEAVVVQTLCYLYTTALSLAGTLTVAGKLTLGGIVVESVDTRTGAGAISLTKSTTKLVTNAANALTLADGVEGQLKRIVMITDGGDGTLTPTTKTGFSTITFNDVGDSVVLQFFTTKGWMIISNNGCTVA